MELFSPFLVSFGRHDAIPNHPSNPHRPQIGQETWIHLAHRSDPGIHHVHSDCIKERRLENETGSFKSGLVSLVRPSLGTLHVILHWHPLGILCRRNVVYPGIVVASFGMFAACIYAPYKEYETIPGSMNENARYAYMALAKPTWSLALAGLLFVLFEGGCPQIRSILAWVGFGYLGKLTFAAYLIHPMVLTFVDFNQVHPQSWSVARFSLDLSGLCLLSFAIALVLHPCIENPLAALLDLQKPAKQVGASDRDSAVRGKCAQDDPKSVKSVAELGGSVLEEIKLQESQHLFGMWSVDDNEDAL
mmetsp:Transcript_36784/g.67901  ORF Transcript_36784/g.67901 Transcript_36784/m.67901 type:complete len:304 (-) Transcript_36784:146-1057(-)